MGKSILTTQRSEVKTYEPEETEREDAPQCAWCLANAGEDMGEGSHGICDEHAERMLADWRAHRAGRAA